MSRRIVSFGLGLLMLWCTLPAFAEATAKPTVSFQRGLVALHAEQIETSLLLHLLAEAAGFELIVIGRVVERLQSWPENEYPLDQLLKSMVAPNGMVVVQRSGQVSEPGQKLLKLIVIGQGEKGSAYALSAVNKEQSTAEQVLLPGITADEPDGRVEGEAISRELTAAYRPLTDADFQEDLKWSVKQLVSNEDSAARIESVRYLAAFGQVEALGIGLGDRDPAVRSEVVAGLAGIGGDGAIQLLGQALLGDGDETVRRAAIVALAEMAQGPLSTIFLQQGLEDSNPAVRLAAEEALSARQ